MTVKYIVVIIFLLVIAIYGKSPEECLDECGVWIVEHEDILNEVKCPNSPYYVGTCKKSADYDKTIHFAYINTSWECFVTNMFYRIIDILNYRTYGFTVGGHLAGMVTIFICWFVFFTDDGHGNLVLRFPPKKEHTDDQSKEQSVASKFIPPPKTPRRNKRNKEDVQE